MSLPEGAEPGRQLAQAQADVRRLEEALADRSKAFVLEDEPITLKALRKHIGPRTALLELTVYHPFDPRAFGTKAAWAAPRYAAYIVRHRGPVVGVDLGETDAIDANARSLRHAISERTPNVTTLARALHEQVVAPIARHLVGVDALQISADGELALAPFEALQSGRGRWLVEEYLVSYLTSGRDLIRLKELAPKATSPMLIGDVDYDAPPSRAGSETLATHWSTLPGARAEVEELAKISLFRNAKTMLGASATESSLRDIQSPRVLHVATHGFFRPAKAAREPGRDTLARAGIVLAGANRGGLGDGDDDGLLTALEASTLDLMGTQLVVLSACETGVGVARGGEGVFGLQRAIAVAGARTFVMSSWQVDDLATRALMVAYYTRLARGEGRAQAMRHVQRLMIAGKSDSDELASTRSACPPGGCQSQSDMPTNWSHPYYWASFRVTGDIGPLRGR